MTTRFSRRVAITLLAVPAAVFAQGFPTKPVTFVYPYAAGSSSDNSWRMINTEAAKRLGQPVVHENRVGGNGRVGMDSVVRAAGDGYTIGMINNPIVVNLPIIDPSYKLDAGREYTPITMAIETYSFFVAAPSAPFKDVRGMLAFAKANPGKLTVGTAGAGTAGHMNLEMLKLLTGAEMTHVPYKGNAPALAAVLGGQVDLMLGIDAPAKAQIQGGKLLGLATTGAQRWGFMPEMPTVAEAGVPGFSNSTWTAVGGSGGMSAEIANRIARAYGEAMNAPEIRSRLEADGWAVRPGTPEQLAATIRSDIERMRPVIKAAGIKPD